MLKGDKVILRPIKRSDVGYFLKWYNNPKIIKYLSLYLPMTEIVEEKWIEETAMSKDLVFFIIESIDNKQQKKPIGSCGITSIDWKDSCGEFGIAIGEMNYWNNGYGTEAGRLLIDYAFMQLNLHRIFSSAFEFNVRSLEMHKKLGFVAEGCSRKEIYKDGQYWNKILFGLLREEWEDQKKKLKKLTV